MRRFFVIFLVTTLTPAFALAANCSSLTGASNIGYWSLNGNANDSSSNAYNLTNVGSVTFTSGGKPTGNESAVLNGTSQQFTCSISSCPNLNVTGAFSVAMWLNFSSGSITGFVRPMAEWSTSSGGEGFFVYYNYNSGSPQLGIETENNNGTQVSWTPSASTWYYVVITLSGTTMTFYANGSSLGTGSQNAPTSLSSGNFELSSALNGNYFGGNMDAAAMWSCTLTSTQVSTLYNSGNGYNPYAVVTTPSVPYNWIEQWWNI
jgi:hypothetical protein